MHRRLGHRFGFLLSVIQLFLMLLGPAQAQEQRIALLIGNGRYVNVPHLANPVEDANALAAALGRLGFNIELTTDADRSTMERAIRAFGQRARNADVALFYYAGHAFQVSDRNLLIPVGADVRDERDLRFETVDLGDVLGQISGRPGINIVLVDACRDNPFSARLGSGTRGVKAMSGPAPISASAGTFIAFATAPGTVAEDGAGSNSPFTAALLDHIEKPGLEIRQLMGRVRQSVRQTTRGRQIPWESSSLEGDFFFRPPERQSPKLDAAVPAPAPGREAELIFWESIKNSQDQREYQAYIERFPAGLFAPLARARIEQLAKPKQAEPPAARTALADGPASAANKPIPAPPAPPSLEGSDSLDSRRLVGFWQGSGTDGAQVFVAFHPTGIFEQRQVYANGFALDVTGRWSLKGRLALLEPRQANPSVICASPSDCRPVPLASQEVPIELRDGGAVLATPYALMGRVVR